MDLPGGAVVENPSASAGDAGSVPAPGGFLRPRDSWACVPQLLSPRDTARESRGATAKAKRSQVNK